MTGTNTTSFDSAEYPEGGKENVGIAFAMVCIAGAASMIGFLAVIFLKKSNTIWLSIGLAFSAGLMIFVSLVEILVEGCIGSFEAAGYSAGASIRYAMLLFYAGCTLVFVFDKVTSIATPYAHISLKMASKSFRRLRRSFKGQNRDVAEKDIECPADEDTITEDGTDDDSPETDCADNPSDTKPISPAELELKHEINEPVQQIDADEVEKNRVLRRMSFLVAMSMAIHNFPEGMAVFLGALADSKFGASIAIAIAVHNIPEGFCIAMPVYYATGSRLKAFAWTLIPSLAEPLGGLIAYLAFRDASDLAFAIAFGIVAGIMVYISVMELLPAAFSFDPNNKYVTVSCLLGMGVMAFSFILLSI